MNSTLKRVAVALCLLLPQAGFADQRTLDKAAAILEQQARSGRGEFVTFLMGAASAYRWESAAPQSVNADRQFCPPPRQTLEGKAYARIVLEEYRRAKSEYAALSEYPLDIFALALQRGLRARYPCPDRPVGAQAGAQPGAGPVKFGMDAEAKQE
jgi:hypothetical protein